MGSVCLFCRLPDDDEFHPCFCDTATAVSDMVREIASVAPLSMIENNDDTVHCPPTKWTIAASACRLVMMRRAWGMEADDDIVANLTRTEEP